MESNEIQLEIATLRSALLEVTHRFELLHTAIDNHECPRCADVDNAYPNKPPKTILCVGTTRQRVTPSQATLLIELIRRPGTVVSYDRIIYVMWESGVKQSWSRDTPETENPKGILSAHLCMLRKRIRHMNCVISTHWGAGLSIWSEEDMNLE